MTYKELVRIQTQGNRSTCHVDPEALEATRAWLYVVKLLAGSTALGWVLVKIGEAVLA